MKRAAFVLAGSLLVATRAHASAEAPYDKHPPPTLYWMIAQFVPSPELGFGNRYAVAGMRWQLTPLLYSFGIYRKLSPWRVFVTEPLTRVSGSLELFVAPEYLTAPAGSNEWITRVGVHANFPLLERGERLGLTFGAGMHWGAESGAFFEGGFTAFSGVFGLFFSYSPYLSLAPAIVTLRVRAF